LIGYDLGEELGKPTRKLRQKTDVLVGGGGGGVLEERFSEECWDRSYFSCFVQSRFMRKENVIPIFGTNREGQVRVCFFFCLRCDIHKKSEVTRKIKMCGGWQIQENHPIWHY